MKRLYLCQDSQQLSQYVIASSTQEAKRQLLMQGFISIKVKIGPRINTHSFKQTELLVITKQLATMLKAGLPIVESLLLLVQEQPKGQWQFLLTEIKNHIAKGETLSQVLARYETVFSPLYQEIIATGELTGQLEDSFAQLAEQLEKSLQLQKRIKKALRYPIFLLSVSIIVALIMLLVVLPKFAIVYASFDAELPFFTQLIVNISEGLQQHFTLFIVFITVAAISYKQYLQKKHRYQIDLWQLKLPILGEIIRISCLTQFFHTLSITQKSGIPLLSGLIAARKTIYNQIYQQQIQRIIQSIEQGHAFSQAINQQPLFPNLCFQLIHVGEESGTLDLMLEKLAVYYQQHSEELTDNLAQKIEPLLMTILAVIIGGLVIAMYLPIFQLGNVIH